MRGNVMDMAVGVIIGGAFGKIVSSMVDDVMMPLISKVTGGVDFTNLYLPLSESVVKAQEKFAAANDGAALALDAAREAGSVLAYGQFLQNTVDFIIVAFCIFLLIKGINKLANMKKKEEAPAEPEAPKGPTQEELLAEIRDLLKQK